MGKTRTRYSEAGEMPSEELLAAMDEDNAQHEATLRGEGDS